MSGKAAAPGREHRAAVPVSGAAEPVGEEGLQFARAGSPGPAHLPRLRRIRRNRVLIETDDLAGPEVAEFLADHLRQMRSVTPPESKHALDLDELRKPGVTFWTVKDGGRLVGCGAIKALDQEHAELKSMRTAPVRRRSGIASRLLEHILTETRRMGFLRLSLETGTGAFFRPARRLYENFGFTYCDPFADYRPDPHSVYMTKRL